MGNFDIFRMSPDKQFFMAASEEERKLKTLSGLLQYPVVYFSEIKKYIPEGTFDKINNLFKIFAEKKYLNLYDDRYEITVDGLFWGNNVDSEVIKICLGG